MMMGYGFGGPLGWIGMGFGMIIHLAFAALIIMAVIWMFRVVFRNGCAAVSPQTSAIEILKQRYAKGEITAEEFKHMKQELE